MMGDVPRRVTMGWDGNPTLVFDSHWVLPRSAERIVHRKYYPTGVDGEWPIDPKTGNPVPIEERS